VDDSKSVIIFAQNIVNHQDGGDGGGAEATGEFLEVAFFLYIVEFEVRAATTLCLSVSDAPKTITDEWNCKGGGFMGQLSLN